VAAEAEGAAEAEAEGAAEGAATAAATITSAEIAAAKTGDRIRVTAVLPKRHS